ncbi:protein kinase precursor [Iris pallida]|uniref:Protein kinase n=1 Tax=Iris pallida TaxID=29817 RepID=A0AAX6DN79_IRIPA|nr:protein kinase precursor [Iris pallida]
MNHGIWVPHLRWIPVQSRIVDRREGHEHVGHRRARTGLACHASHRKLRHGECQVEWVFVPQAGVDEAPQLSPHIIASSSSSSAQHFAKRPRQQQLPPLLLLLVLVVLGIRRLPAGQELQQDHSEGEHVELGRDEPVLEVLGGHVSVRPDHMPSELQTSSSVAVLLDRPRKPEVRQLRPELGVEQDVAALHVLVDVGRAGVVVEVVEAVRDVVRDPDPLLPAEHRGVRCRPVLPAASAAVEPVAQGAPLDELVDEVGAALVDAQPGEPDDAGVVDLLQDADLARHVVPLQPLHRRVVPVDRPAVDGPSDPVLLREAARRPLQILELVDHQRVQEGADLVRLERRRRRRRGADLFAAAAPVRIRILRGRRNGKRRPTLAAAAAEATEVPGEKPGQQDQEGSTDSDADEYSGVVVLARRPATAISRRRRGRRRWSRRGRRRGGDLGQRGLGL